MTTKSGTYGAPSPKEEEQLPANNPGRATVGKATAGHATRSDEDIWRDIRDRLDGEPQLASAAIEIEVAQGAVTLAGSVPDQWCIKQAEAAAMGTRGARNVRNALRIELEGVGGTGNAAKKG